jgi:GMP synthase (glutamine-hydrolysing)
VDPGLMRKKRRRPGDGVYHRAVRPEVKRVNAQSVSAKLAGVTEPERKRKIIGRRVHPGLRGRGRKALSGMRHLRFPAPGTIYPTSLKAAHSPPRATIKSHHNVGRLPEDVEFTLLEPLRMLFKDEVRQWANLGHAPRGSSGSQPFPGPGLDTRCLGEVREDKLCILRDADWISEEEIAQKGLEREIWQLLRRSHPTFGPWASPATSVPTTM